MTDLSASSFIAKLVDDGIGTPAFFDSTFDKDFILLAEFCELEGPKPIFTIPATFNSTFNLNTFAVRIMSVDCVSVMQTTDFSDFTVAGDIQVVLTEMSEGAVAYVHHFVLYDVCARGFVRPFCLAYITKHHSELLTIFEKLKNVFSLASKLFHFGNALSFINDLMLRLQHLFHLRNVLTDNQVCDVFVDDVMLTEHQKKGITTKALDEATVQLERLMEIFQMYVEGGMFSEHRDLFSPRYSEMREKVTNDKGKSSHFDKDNENNAKRFVHVKESERLIAENSDSYNEIMFQSDRPSHRVPSDVISSILGKKYDKRLRSLNELCDVTCDVGLDILKYFLHLFTTKGNTPIHNLFLVEPQIFDEVTKMHVGTMEFPVIPHMPKAIVDHESEVDCCAKRFDDEQIETPSIKNFLRHFINLENKLNSISNTPNSNNIKSNIHRSSNVSEVTKDGDLQRHFGGLNYSFLSLLKYTSISLPALNSTNMTNTQSKVGSFINISMAESARQQVNSRKSTVCGSENSSSDSYQDALTCIESGNSSANSTESTKNSACKNMIRSVSGTSSETVVSVDGVKEKAKSTKVSLLKLRENYSNILPHVVYTLFIGRPLIIIGDEENSRKVSALVYAFANFLPTNSLRSKKIYPWITRKLTLPDLEDIGIVGLPKVGETKNPIPSSLRCYVSMLDYNTQILHAPYYYGDRLAGMFDATKQFNEITFRKFIAQIWSEIVSEAYVRFVSRYTDANLFRIANASGVRPTVNDSESALRALRAKAASCDLDILMYFVETLKIQLLIACNDGASEYEDFSISNIKLSNKKCQIIANTTRRKK